MLESRLLLKATVPAGVPAGAPDRHPIGLGSLREEQTSRCQDFLPGEMSLHQRLPAGEPGNLTAVSR